jgi:hypothetical protein
LSLVEKTLDHEFRGIVLGSIFNFNYINAYKFFRGISSLRMMEQKLGFTPMSFIFSKGHYFIEYYNKVIGRLRDAGITEYWLNFYQRKNEKVDDFGPQVLTMDHLEVCFYVCAFPFIFALIAFIGERNAERFKKLRFKIQEKIQDKIILRCSCPQRIRHRITKVYPFGHERDKTKWEKFSSAFKEKFPNLTTFSVAPLLREAWQKVLDKINRN